MEAEFEANSQKFEGLITEEEDGEGCEAEVMALVVIDEFPIEASHQRAMLSTSCSELTSNTRSSTRSSKTTLTRPTIITSG
jgi:hypothetical protein